MIIDGTISSDKTRILVEKYASLLNSGVDASEILVLVGNSSLKDKFINATLENLKISCFEKLQVHSYFSLVYNAINDNWAFLENKNPFPNPKVLPNLTGLEISQFILKNILKNVKFSGYNSKKSLLHQLFRRYSLIVQNNLSDEEIDYRSHILREAFGDDAKFALKNFLKQTLALRDFDYLRQSLVFEHIYKNTDYFNKIQYLILDDGDEITPACYDFIEYLKPRLKKYYIAFDKKGSSRIGYLSADKTAVWEFEKLFDEPVITIDTNTKLRFDAENLYSNVLNDANNTLEYFSRCSPSKRSKMIEITISKINELIKKGTMPSEISIITPVVDDMLKFTLKESLYQTINPLYLTGSEKLIQNKLVLTALNILKFNTELQQTLSEFDIRPIFVNCLDIPLKYCFKILEEFDKTKTLIQYTFDDDEYSSRYDKLINLITNVLPKKEKLSEQVLAIYQELMLFKSYERNEIVKFNFFIKQLEDFENVFGDNFSSYKEEYITQMENSIISENPYSTIEIHQNDLVIGTPQKIIDNQVMTKYQFWLDISSQEWVKSDTGPLYNAWVFQKGWSKDEYTVEDNVLLSKEKTARLLRKLTLCADENIFAYSSLFDGNGVENFGGIEEYIKVKFEDNSKKQKAGGTFVITPRDDQKPVLDYKSGRMAISAVPGAGKTTILLALIIKLLERGIDPNNIFVMTYMESAARNFRERIKSVRENSSELPYISTIHGLALRIIKENGNHERLGLNADFDICDDTQKTRITREVLKKVKIDDKNLNEFIQGISVYKLGRGDLKNIKNNDKKLLLFKSFFEEYQRILNTNNLIDYDDILLLSVKLLEENSDIREYYQNICQYIIEDEAQDSSSVQQSLINMLSGKYNNLIRCGDINQAITTTFTNADVKGFRKFIETSQQVSMDCSQRCCEDVWKLANTVLLDAEAQEETKEAFYHIIMKPVEGKNPVSENAVVGKIFENPNEEKNYILKEINHLFSKNPKATVGILVRNNKQVIEWMNIINNNGFKCITRSECLAQKSVFRVIFAVLNIILKPFDNAVLAESYTMLADLGFYKVKYADIIKNYSNHFIEANYGSVEITDLEKFLWEINYWTSFPHLTPDELAIKIGLNYFNTEIEKANIYLISTLIKRLSFDTKNLKTIVDRLGELSQRSSLSGFKFFSEEDESDKEILEGKVQVMTLHKSKGDEFDCVFLPEMTERSLTIDFSKLKYKNSDFMEQLKALNSNYKEKSEYELKQDLVSENLRLLYVAITRAKRKLHITTSEKVKAFGKLKKEEPNKIFDIL